MLLLANGSLRNHLTNELVVYKLLKLQFITLIFDIVYINSTYIVIELP